MSTLHPTQYLNRRTDRWQVYRKSYRLTYPLSLILYTFYSIAKCILQQLKYLINKFNMHVHRRLFVPNLDCTKYLCFRYCLLCWCLIQSDCIVLYVDRHGTIINRNRWAVVVLKRYLAVESWVLVDQFGSVM